MTRAALVFGGIGHVCGVYKVVILRAREHTATSAFVNIILMLLFDFSWCVYSGDTFVVKKERR